MNAIIDIQKLIQPSSTDQNIDLTRGYNLIFGSLSKTVLIHLCPNLLITLISNCTPKGAQNDDADT